MLTYKKTNNLEVIGYSNSDFAGWANSQKSTSNYLFTLANGHIMEKLQAKTHYILNDVR
jgi:hypothetical protein